jgi:hypothetical protein
MNTTTDRTRFLRRAETMAAVVLNAAWVVGSAVVTAAA